MCCTPTTGATLLRHRAAVEPSLSVSHRVEFFPISFWYIGALLTLACMRRPTPGPSPTITPPCINGTRANAGELLLPPSPYLFGAPPLSPPCLVCALCRCDPILEEVLIVELSAAEKPHATRTPAEPSKPMHALAALALRPLGRPGHCWATGRPFHHASWATKPVSDRCVFGI
jgi:hypothetical protein